MQENYGGIEDEESADYALLPPRYPGESDETNGEAELFTQKLEGLFVDSDVWASAESSYVEACDCVPQLGTHESKSSKDPEINGSRPPDGEQNQSVLGTNTATDSNVPLTSELLMFIMKSHRTALAEQRSVMASLTEAINRLATAIENQTKMMRLFNSV